MDDEITPTAQSVVDNLTCNKCGRAFKNATGLRMHDIRKHTGRKWASTGKLKTEDKAEKRKAYKKQYDLKKKQERLSPQNGVNFCPECGCNLQVYNVARAAAERL